MITTLEPPKEYKRHSKHVEFLSRLRTCKECGEMYFSIDEVFIGTLSGKMTTRIASDPATNSDNGNMPFLKHLREAHNY